MAVSPVARCRTRGENARGPRAGAESSSSYPAYTLLTDRIIDQRYWEPPVGPPPLAPPPNQQPVRPSNNRSNHSTGSHLSHNFENLSLSSQTSKSSNFSFGKKEGGEKKKLFKMKWGKD